MIRGGNGDFQNDDQDDEDAGSWDEESCVGEMKIERDKERDEVDEVSDFD